MQIHLGMRNQGGTFGVLAILAAGPICPIRKAPARKYVHGKEGRGQAAEGLMICSNTEFSSPFRGGASWTPSIR